MDVTKIAPYAKFVVAITGAVLATATVLVDGNLSLQDISTIVAAWGTAGLVWSVPNKPL